MSIFVSSMRKKACISSLAGMITIFFAYPVAFAGGVEGAVSPNWTGWYVGFNGGWVGSTNRVHNRGTGVTLGGLGTAIATGAIPEVFPLRYNGGLLGGSIGYNYQFYPRWLVGAETDFDWAAAKKSVTLGPEMVPGFEPIIRFQAKRQLLWFGTLRGRLGISAVKNKLLFYLTGGLAYGRHRLGGAFICPLCNPSSSTQATTAVISSKTSVGWGVGMGMEFAFLKRYSVRLEYLYINLGKIRNTIQYNYVTTNPLGPLPVGTSQDSTLTSTVEEAANIVRIGLNIKFN